ncbi:MAG: ABC transporter substrate-binding protein [Gemmatimonadales bacterium]
MSVAAAPPAATQRPPSDQGTAVIVLGQEPATPVPTLLGAKANSDVSELLFLRLARPERSATLADEGSYRPELARRWRRRDSLTIEFELDPRARWHDGTPVTARDVVWSFARMRDSTVDPQRAVLLRHLETVAAEGSRVVFRFRRAYAEQLYDAVWHVQPLPAHLVDSIPPARFAGSAFVQRPVGNGPYRWVRREPGRQLELGAVPDFFLGAPRLTRVVFVLARDPEAQLNLLLDGTADMLESLSPVSAPPRLAAGRDIRIVPVPSFSVGFLLFNQRAHGDRSRPHPILSDVAVRRAIAMALDRPTLARSAFASYAAIPDAPVAQAHWTARIVPSGMRHDPGRARALLRSRGWIDADGDGVLEKDGVPLSLRLNLPTTSASRVTIAPQIQEQLRQVGIRLELVRLDGPVWFERRTRGEFDIDFSSASMDPSPSGIVQSWTCAGRRGSNVGQYCNPAVDSLIERAVGAPVADSRLWREAYTRLQADAPAVFLFSPATPIAVHARFRNVTIRPESFYGDLWRWSVDPGRRLPRDGGRGSGGAGR